MTDSALTPTDASSAHDVVVTLLFTDIEGSTRMWEERPKAMATALQRHDTLLHSIFTALDGHVFKTVGDAFCVAFTSPASAVTSAVRAQRDLASESWVDGLEIKVRMGLHTGSCDVRNDDYFGPAVNRVARLSSTAHGGQIVLSAATAAAVEHDLPDGTRLTSLGSHRLKDLTEQEDVFQLDIDGLVSSFPPLQSVVGPVDRTNLPAPRGTFIGRDVELTRLSTALSDHRLVTLTGPGGTGKTTLAVEGGRRLLSTKSDGVWLVELAGLSDPSLVGSAIAQTLNLALDTRGDVADALVGALGAQQRLLILDNCEHLLDAVGDVVDRLLRDCSKVSVIATSREPLHVDGELVMAVPALSLPESPVTSIDEARRYDAVALFLDRVATQAPDAHVTDSDCAAIISICRRLDGIPLALELAAARVRSLSLLDVDQRLSERFNFLRRGSQGRLERQQTLDAMVRWSYDLLDEDEQAVFRELSVFSSGFTLIAAEAVCSHDPFDALTSLADKSMLIVQHHDGRVRYSMLETLLEFGRLRLRESSTTVDADDSDFVATNNRHAEYFTRQAVTYLERNRGTDAIAVFASTYDDRHNFISAAEWLVGRGERSLTQAWELFGGLIPLADIIGRSEVLLTLVNRSLEFTDEGSLAARGRALCFRSRLAEFTGDFTTAIHGFVEAVELGRRSGDATLEVLAASTLAAFTQDVALGASALTTAMALRDPWIQSVALGNYGISLFSTDPAQAYEKLGEAQSLARATGLNNTQLVLSEMLCLGALSSGDLDQARQYVDSGLDIVAKGYARNPKANSIRSLNGWVLLAEGSPERARSEFAEGFVRARLVGQFPIVKSSLLGSACCYSELGRLDLARRLLIASETLPSLELGYGKGFIAEARARCLDELELSPESVVGLSGDSTSADALDILEREIVAAANA